MKTYKRINLIIKDGKVVAMDIVNNETYRVQILAEWEEDTMSLDEVLQAIKEDLS